MTTTGDLTQDTGRRNDTDALVCASSSSSSGSARSAPGGWRSRSEAAVGEPSTDPAARLRQLVGGPRGLVEGGLPPVTFVVTNTVAPAAVGGGRALTLAITAAALTGLALALVAVVQRRPLRQALAGLAGVAVAGCYAAWADDARAYFLPGIWVDAAYALALAGSVLAGRPLIGAVHDWLFAHDHRRWREDTRLRRAVVVLTLGWAGMYALRATVQSALYAGDQPHLLAVAKLGLGWPLTIAAAAISLAWLRHIEVTTDSTAVPLRVDPLGEAAGELPVELDAAGVGGEAGSAGQRDDDQAGADSDGHRQPEQQHERRDDEEAAADTGQSPPTSPVGLSTRTPAASMSAAKPSRTTSSGSSRLTPAPAEAAASR